MEASGAHPFAHIFEEHKIDDKSYKFFNMAALGDPRYATLPFSIRVLLESAVRNCDNFNISSKSQ